MGVRRKIVSDNTICYADSRGLKISTTEKCIIGPLCLQVPHPQIQPTVD